MNIPKACGVEATNIRRVAVIGAGSMGGGIAAQIANSGIPVDLLDIAGDAGPARNAPAQAGIERQLKTRGFMIPDAAALVQPGNVEDNLDRLAQADWIIEVIIENVEAKRELYRKIDAVRKPGAFVSSNTSTILRSALTEGMSEGLRKDFLITHFFNPPRVMQLVEIIAGPENPLARVEALKEACVALLGKTPIDCKDTPGFIANRIGCYILAVAAIEAIRQNIEPEEADAVMTVLGTPRTGVFGLLDLIGIDLIPYVWGSLSSALPAADAIHAHDLTAEPLVRDMIANGQFGRKSGAGFYRMTPSKTRQTLDLRTGDYRDAITFDKSALPGGGKDLAALLDDEGRLGRFAWKVFSELVSYVSGNGGDIAFSAEDIDQAMVLGYGFSHGPLALARRYGGDKLRARCAREGRPAPALLDGDLGAGAKADSGRARKELSLRRIKGESQPVLHNDSASLWDLGDGVACFEIHTKLNSFAPGVHELLEPALARIASDFRALVLGNDDPRAFSAGADLRAFLGMIKQADWQGLSGYIARGQALFLQMKYAPFPVVAAAHGLALGGGCEFMLNADAIIAHAELSAGLPEAKVGIIPGWGGGTQLLIRAAHNPSLPQGPFAELVSVFDFILKGEFTTSALDARKRGVLLASDRIVMSRNRLLSEAKALAVEMAADYRVPGRAAIKVAGQPGYDHLLERMRALKDAGAATDADMAIAEVLAGVLSGGGAKGATISEEEMMRLELEGNLALSKLEATAARMEHMLATNKPLRN